MKITVIAVGKIKENYWNDAIVEYSKRLKPYVQLKIIECADVSAKENSSERELEEVKRKEAEQIELKIPKGAYTIALAIKGNQYSSDELAIHIDNLKTKGISEICYIIGGSVGLYRELENKVNEKISFGKNTYPHQMMRVILIEQIYRVEKINRGEPYHK